MKHRKNGVRKGGNDYDYNIMQQKRWKDSNILSIVNWLTIQIIFCMIRIRGIDINPAE
jgi:preprotein translocase subunit Sec63